MDFKLINNMVQILMERIDEKRYHVWYMPIDGIADIDNGLQEYVSIIADGALEVTKVPDRGSIKDIFDSLSTGCNACIDIVYRDDLAHLYPYAQPISLNWELYKEDAKRTGRDQAYMDRIQTVI